MKRITRMIAGMLVLTLLCFGLCGCQALDDLRKATGQVRTDGAIEMSDGTVYLPLDIPDGVTPLDEEAFTEYIMTAPAEYNDLPLLLYPFYGADNACYRDRSGILIQNYGSYGTLLCREDHVKKYEDMLGDESVYTAYYSMPDYLYENFFMTEEQQKALNTVLQGDAVPADDFDYESLVLLNKATDDHTFGMDAKLAIGCSKGKYYVYDFGRDSIQVYQIPVPPAALSAIQAYYKAYQDKVETYYDSEEWY